MKQEIQENNFLWKQEIFYTNKQIKIILGIGLMNGKGEISKDFPLDILIVIGALLELKNYFDLDILFILGDQNAIAELEPGQTEKLKEINDITDNHNVKLTKILKKFNLFENSNIIKASSIIENENYKKIELPKNNNTPYANEQLRIMKYYKELGYNYRLSWKGRKHSKNDEEYFDKLYIESFKENPMTSIFIKSGKKSLPCGTGTAVPYSYFQSEENKRIPFRQIDKFNFANEKIKSHTINILKYFINDCEINEDSYNSLVRVCLSESD